MTVLFLQMDLTTFIQKQQCECLNESDDHPFSHCLTGGGGYLESDCDEQVRFIPQVAHGAAHGTECIIL
jgi:hypothetical protein